MTIKYWATLSDLEKNMLLQRSSSRDLFSMQKTVRTILQDVKEKGDAAVRRYTKQYDRVYLKNYTMTTETWTKIKKHMTRETISALQFARENIFRYHLQQKPTAMKIKIIDGLYCERIPKAIDRVGLYIPGGSAPLISTLLMLATPAAIAGCAEIVVCTPPDALGEIHPMMIAAASLCGIKTIYKVGGAQAIAAMAYGTATIPRVHKIFGPGNRWVTLAKKMIAMDETIAVTIDMPAGPSELCVIADTTAHPAWVAADLLSQAEHGPDSKVMMISNSSALLEAVQPEIQKQIKTAPRKKIMEQSLAHACFIKTNSIHAAIEIVNDYAPEHCILALSKPQRYRDLIRNAGAVFIGHNTPETLGDYVTGSNHVLPTGGYANSISGLSVSDFCKYISFQTATSSAFKRAAPHAQVFAKLEGLLAHENAVRVRL